MVTSSLLAMRRVPFLVFTVLSLSIGVVYGQIIGTDLCFCQPATYELKLNFSLVCADSSINNSTPGILETGCLVESRGQTENITDPIPVLVSEVQIVELGPNLENVGQALYTDTYSDGAILTYTSIVQSTPQDITVANLPRGFQVTITGINSLQESLTQLWIIKYDNECSIFPLLTVGQQMGWTIFVSYCFTPNDGSFN
jgi:hypothetical protein